MANQGGKKDEHKMLFDLRGGKRGAVVKVVYAVLAVLMGLSLLLIAGPLPFGDIFGGEDAQELAQDQSQERIERIEVKLAKNPDDPAQLLNLTRAQLAAASSYIEEVGPEQIALTPEARQQYEQAASSWDEYVAVTNEPSIGTAQQMANTFLQLAETSPNLEEGEANINAAAEAQRIVADRRPSIGSLGTLALYTVLSFDYAQAQEYNKEAMKFANTKIEREQLENQFEETEKRAKELEKELREQERFREAAEKGQAQQQGGGGEGQSNPNPFGFGGALSE